VVNLITENLSIESARENFQKLNDFIKTHPILGGNFKHFEITVENASATYKVYHRLGFRPKDVIITYISSGTATPVYNSFTTELIELNVSGASTIRLLIGSAKAGA